MQLLKLEPMPSIKTPKISKEKSLSPISSEGTQDFIHQADTGNPLMLQALAHQALRSNTSNKLNSQDSLGSNNSNTLMLPQRRLTLVSDKAPTSFTQINEEDEFLDSQKGTSR